MKKIIILLFFLALVIVPLSAKAQVSGNVAISANIDSKISKANSIVTVSTHETLADPSSHSILITVQLFDAANNPLPNLNVVLSSSRGSVDAIEAISKLGSGQDYDAMRRDTTDATGKASFRISSFVPGKTTINILADQIVSFDPVELQFLPLPFPTNVTITVPIFNKEITLYSPKPQEENLTNIQEQSKTLVNTGTKIQIPFFYFLLFWILILIGPIFIIINYINLKKVKKMEAQELASLQRIEKQENIKS